MNKIIGAALAILFVGFAMYLSAEAAGVTIKGYIDIISFFLVFGVSYFGMVAAYGTFIPDMKGLKLMNKLFTARVIPTYRTLRSSLVKLVLESTAGCSPFDNPFGT